MANGRLILKESQLPGVPYVTTFSKLTDERIWQGGQLSITGTSHKKPVSTLKIKCMKPCSFTFPVMEILALDQLVVLLFASLC